MRIHEDAKRIVRLLWALVSLTIVVGVLVNLALGWGIVNQRDAQGLILAEKVSLTDQEAEVRLLVGVVQSAIRGHLDPAREVAFSSAQVMGESLQGSLNDLLEQYPMERDDGHGPAVMSHTAALNSLAEKTRAWRQAHDLLAEDVSRDVTLDRVRRHLSVINATVNSIIGRERVRAVLELKRYERAGGAERAELAEKVMAAHRDLLKGVFSGLQRELADIQRLVEVLGGEDQYDRLSDIRDNMLKPGLDRLRRDSMLLAQADPGGARIMMSEMEHLLNALFGQGYVFDQDHQTIQTGSGGLYRLRLDYLQLLQERLHLEGELDRLVGFFERDWSILFQDIQGDLEKRENLLQQQLSETWLYVALVSLLGAAVFLILVHMIFNAISGQVEILYLLRREAENSNEVKSKFLASMSHELRTPLNAIIGFSEMIRQNAFGALGHPKYQEYARDIHLSGRHLLDIIDDILDVSSIEAGKFELTESDFDLAETINEALQMILLQAGEAGLIVRNDVVNDRIPICADQRLVRQIIVNLLSNAVKFTPSGGVIAIESKYGRGGEFQLIVTDTGIGMDDDGIKTALTPFGMVKSAYEGRHRGTGLGLPLAKSMMELHGGRLEVESMLNVGTRITLSFPAERMLDPKGETLREVNEGGR